MFEEIAEIIAQQFGVEPKTITADTTFQGDLGADSVDIVELSIAMEDQYGISEMSEEDIAGIATVGDLVNFIQSATEG